MRTLAAILLLTLAGPATAGWRWPGELETLRTFIAQETFTDNVTIAPDGQKENDFVTELSTSLLLRSLTRRTETDVDLQLQGLVYANDSSRNNHNLLFTGASTVEILDERFFLDLDANLAPQNISNTGPIALDNINVVGGRRDTLSYQFRPRLEQRLGRWADASASWSFDAVRISGLEGSDSDRTVIQAGLESGTRFARVLWTAEFRQRDIESENAAVNTDSRFTEYWGNAEYPLTSTFAVQATLGRDDNEFGSSSSTSGMRWNIGIDWRPSRRTHLEATIGERFFGRDVAIDASWARKRVRLVANFVQQASVTRGTLADTDAFVGFDAFGQPITDLTDVTLQGLDPGIATQTAEVLVTETFRFAAEYRLSSHLLALNLNQQEREFQASGDPEETQGGSFSWIWTPGRRTSSIFSLSRTTNDRRDGITDVFNQINWRVTRNLTPDFDANINLRFVSRESDSAALEFDEFRAGAGISKRF